MEGSDAFSTGAWSSINSPYPQPSSQSDQPIDSQQPGLDFQYPNPPVSDPSPHSVHDDPTTGDVMRKLFHAVIAVGNSTQEQQHFQERQASLLGDLEDQLRETREELACLRAQPQPPVGQPMNVSAAHPARAPSIKLQEPRKFNGQSSQVRPFLDDINTAIALQGDAFQNDSQKVKYMAYYLNDGAPKLWLHSIEISQPMLLWNYAGFVDVFIARFKEQDLPRKYRAKLEALEQHGTAAAYANTFQEYLSYLNWTNENLKIQRFDNGLKPELQRELIRETHPSTLQAWIPKVINTDNRLRAWEDSVKGRKGKSSALSSSCHSERSGTTRTHVPNPAPAPAPPAPPAGISNDVVLMEINAMHHGPISQVERQRRMDNNLCLYCGKPGHRRLECPTCQANEAVHARAKAAPQGKA